LYFIIRWLQIMYNKQKQLLRASIRLLLKQFFMTVIKKKSSIMFTFMIDIIIIYSSQNYWKKINNTYDFLIKESFECFSACYIQSSLKRWLSSTFLIKEKMNNFLIFRNCLSFLCNWLFRKLILELDCFLMQTTNSK